jgi:hypothetical protein
MLRLLPFILVLLLLGCSTETQQLKTVRQRAMKDIEVALGLPEGTRFRKGAISVNEEVPKVTDDGAVYVVKITVEASNTSGENVMNTYVLRYKKIGEGGLDPQRL